MVNLVGLSKSRFFQFVRQVFQPGGKTVRHIVAQPHCLRLEPFEQRRLLSVSAVGAILPSLHAKAEIGPVSVSTSAPAIVSASTAIAMDGASDYAPLANGAATVSEASLDPTVQIGNGTAGSMGYRTDSVPVDVTIPVHPELVTYSVDLGITYDTTRLAIQAGSTPGAFGNDITNVSGWTGSCSVDTTDGGSGSACSIRRQRIRLRR